MTTINTSSNNALRLTVRVEVGSYQKSVDLAIPASSKLAEIVDEIIALVEAPVIFEPWEAITAAGQQLPMSDSLADCHLSHGDILVLRPHRDDNLPLIHDVAESLETEATRSTIATGTSLAAAGVGYLAWVIICLGFPTPAPIMIPTPARLFLVFALTLGMLWWTKHILFAAFTFITVMALGGLLVIGEKLTPNRATQLSDTDFAFSWGLALIAAACCALLMSLLIRLIIPSIMMLTTMVTIAIFLILSGIGALLYRPSLLTTLTPSWSWMPHAAGLVVATGVLFIAFSPACSIKLSGLKVPVVPSAGQDLAVADEPSGQDHHHGAEIAHHILAGLLLGTGIILGPTILTIGALAPQRGFASGLGISLCMALLLHAHRHRNRLCTWVLWLIALASALSCLLASFRIGQDSPWYLIVVCLIVTLLLLTAPGWAEKVGSFEPTTVVWLERAEALAVAATLPLALHIFGLFGLLRGIAL